MTYDEFCERFRKVRKINNRTSIGLSKELNRSKEYISSVENGKLQLSVSDFLYICKILKITPKEFFDKKYPFKTMRQKMLFTKIELLRNKDFEVVRNVVVALLNYYN